MAISCQKRWFAIGLLEYPGTDEYFYLYTEDTLSIIKEKSCFLRRYSDVCLFVFYQKEIRPR